MSQAPSHGRSTFIQPEVDHYTRTHSTPPDEVARELRRATELRTGSAAGMQIGDDQARLFEIIVRAMGARRALEIGTFTGYSALAIARGLGPEGRLTCCDVSPEWTSIAQSFWERAGVDHRIDLRIGPALETLASLPGDDLFDVVFIDADKTNYPHYYEVVLPLVRPGGLILIDNTLQGGRVLDEDSTSPEVLAVRDLNDALVHDSRVTVVQLPLGDGVTCVSKS